MNKATTEIINILSSMGCKPAATGKNNNQIIKLNAPSLTGGKK